MAALVEFATVEAAPGAVSTSLKIRFWASTLLANTLVAQVTAPRIPTGRGFQGMPPWSPRIPLGDGAGMRTGKGV